jgi:tRNA G10  N-methylase Trm11
VVVAKNKLLPPEGCEFILIPEGEADLLVGRTLWVQAFEEWSERDYGRPERDAKVGMLPPKLAHMMVNLAQVPPEGTLLDPFCGSGTVLQEAAVLGYRNLIGADSDARGVERTRANFEWLKQRYPGLSEPELAVSDIRKLLSTLQNRQFDAIVTEPYLGPPLKGSEQQGELRQVVGRLTELYGAALKVLAQALRTGGRLVMVWPVLRGRGEEHLLELLAEVQSVDLRVQNVLPESAPHTWHRKRGSLLYERPDQHVAREIFVLQKR